MKLLRLIADFWNWLFHDGRPELGGLTEVEYEEWDFLECLAENMRLSKRDQIQLDYLRVKRGIDDKGKGTG